MNTKSLQWLADNLLKHSQVASISIVGNQFLRIDRNDFDPVLTLVMSVARVTADLIEEAIGEEPACTFACNIPKNGIWEGDSLSVAEEHSLGWGGVGDLMAALNDEDVQQFEPKIYRFGSRFLRQNGSIASTERLSDSVIKITSMNGTVYRVAMLYAYEMTADAVRTHFDRYSPFDIILRTNPNGGPTSEAREAAEQIGVQIFTYRELTVYIRNNALPR